MLVHSRARGAVIVALVGSIAVLIALSAVSVRPAAAS